MQKLIQELEKKQRKHQVVDVQSGDTVRVYQRIEESGKSRTQMFEGLVIRTDRPKSLTSRITVRRIASGVGVEKSFLLHSPLVEKIEVVKRSKVRRNNLSYMRQRAGKSARLSGIDFDREAVNTIEEQQNEAAGITDDIQSTDADEKVDTDKEQEQDESKTSDSKVVKDKANDKKDAAK